MTSNEETKNRKRLMCDFVNGTRRGFNAMHAEFHKRLLYFAFKMISDLEAAEDIVSIVITRAFEKHWDFDTYLHLKAYLFISVKNRCLKYIKAKKFTDEVKEDHALTDDYIEAQIIRTEFLHQIYKRIEMLPPMRKQVFKLYYLEGLSITEIAKQLNISPDAASNNKLRALRQLRSILQIE